jgi:hypothetical protein
MLDALSPGVADLERDHTFSNAIANLAGARADLAQPGYGATPALDNRAETRVELGGDRVQPVAMTISERHLRIRGRAQSPVQDSMDRRVVDERIPCMFGKRVQAVRERRHVSVGRLQRRGFDFQHEH